MADARALLRQQREARRIQHPHATYSDAGKLLCAPCREPIKSDNLWDSHVKSTGHRQRLQALKDSREAATAATESTDAATVAPTQKRKLDADDDDVEPMDTSEQGSRKRTKAATTSETTTTPPAEDASTNGKDKDKDTIRTPPNLTRRTSTTPSQGIELQIPSRPATPAHRDSSSSSTPGGAGGSTLNSAVTGTLPRQPSILGPGTPSTAAGAASAAETRPSSTAPQVDESEWAAFEADIAATAVPYDEDATISAPAMNAEEAAAAAAAIADESDVKRKSQADIDIEDEREEATRAMEDEFEDMQELEARVQKLKDQREALRSNRTGSQSIQNGDAIDQIKKSLQQEKSKAVENVEEEEEDDEDDDEDDDEWDGFRFRR